MFRRYRLTEQIGHKNEGYLMDRAVWMVTRYLWIGTLITVGYVSECHTTRHLTARIGSCIMAAIVIRVLRAPTRLGRNPLFNASVSIVICTLVAAGWIVEAVTYAYIVDIMAVVRTVISRVDVRTTFKTLMMVALISPFLTDLKIIDGLELYLGFGLLMCILQGIFPQFVGLVGLFREDEQVAISDDAGGAE